METSAPKRRKTSPTTSVPVNGQNGDDYPNNTSTTPTDPAPAASSRGEGRPSFASPTRASLARHNPDVLDKHKATTAAAAAASRTRRRGAAAAAPERGASQLASDAGNDASDPVDGQREQGLTGHGESQGAANQRRPASRSPERSIGGPDGLLSAMPRRTPVKLPPRPLPPPGPADDEPINPFRGRALRRSWTGLAPPPPPPEPELPPTPEHREPSANTPPSGIHNTPSKRARRSKVLAERIRSSPSKPPSSAAAFSPSREPTTLPAATAAPPPSKPVAQRLFGARARRRMSSIGPIVIDEQPEESPVADVGAGDQAEDADHVAALALRGIEPSGPETARRAERDALLAEIAQLQADVDALARENRRFEDTDDADDADGQAAVDALRRHLLPQDAEPEVDADMQWLEVALNPISFLPFAKPSAQPPPSLFGADVSSRAKGDEPTPPVSHHPIQMTAEEELPFLQVFTPLSFSSQITVLPRGEGAAAAAPLLQRHAITVGSTTPPGLFAAQISITVDTATHTIRELAVPRLYPAAAPELAQLIADTTAATGAAARPVRSRLNNISVLGWAMAEWVRVATRRARFWCALEAELATKDGVAAAAARARARARRNKGRRGNGNKRQQRGRDASGDLDPDATEDDDEDEDQDADPSDAGSRSFSRRDLLPHMGRTAMELGVPAAGAGEEDGQTVSLMVRWRIGFDWTGEAESEVELLAGVPGKSDQRGKLHAIPELFQKLIKDEGDPIVAVRTVVALLSGDGS
ncbi:hypothetical protein RB595_000452 [Gaeumannomyces hyphopodioides]